jgi:hypothetical protein
LIKKSHLNQNNKHEKHKQKEITLKNKGSKKKNSLHKKQTKRGVRKYLHVTKVVERILMKTHHKPK